MAVADSGVLFCLFLIAFQGILNTVVVEALKCDEQGKFGWRCRFTCNCIDGSECEKETGHCKEGCAEGFYGTGCQFKNEYIYGREQGKGYMGKVDETGDNKKCLSWDDPKVTAKQKDYRKNNFPDEEIPGPYCRNPLDPEILAYSKSPWCYTLNNKTKQVEFGHCSQLKVTVCPDYLFGDKCDKECHCSNETEICQKDTGYCKQNCHAGWMGIGCDQPCVYNKYGIDCKKLCGHCQFDSCDHETGICLKGCKSGFHNAYCTQKCGSGVYGVNCKERCGRCRHGDCDPETGECLGGCLPGYTGPLCKDSCPNGKYGYGCSERCPYCHNRGPCHPETGVCERGCAPGYMGQSCDMECLDGFFGANCTRACGHCLSGKPCDKYTGQCIEGCDKGYAGSDCFAAPVQVKEGSMAGGIVGGIIAGIVVTAIVIFLLIYRKRRFRTKMIVTRDLSMSAPEKEIVIDNVEETSMLLRSSSAAEVNGPVDEEDSVDNIYDKTTHEPIYVNVNTKNLRNPINVDDLHSFINKAKDNDYAIMRAEHGDLPTGLLALCHTALKPENKAKNRYADIIAWVQL
ncbi:protein draper-like [Mercenaria mercenaria]|uniref:protein draper-like n=1 Tax=Mercenaria mercenaria TaxID=6596 RepID=UPI00234F5253|nr:protein draper-like [Mercenaria mercenaria]